MRTDEVELAVARYFNTRTNLIVPNISWGLYLHECDLLVITKAGYAYEVEIKVSLSDLKADAHKGHNHNSKKIKKLYFAIPEKLLVGIEHIPSRAGIIIIKSEPDYLWCQKYREAQVTGDYKFSMEERLKVAMLGTMRMWNCKRIIFDRREAKP